jgi:GNAT superfamily N-acetyltransferase
MPYEVDLPGGFAISDAQERLDVEAIHRFISEQSYWGRGRAREVMERSLRHSIAFGLYAPDGGQIGLARVVSDRAIRAHVADVYVLPEYRGHGLGKSLVAAVLAHPELVGVSTWSLVTTSAHGLYAGFGFVPLGDPERHMVRVAAAPAAKSA